MLSFLHRMLSIKNKKQNRVVFALTLFLFSAGVFFLSPSSVHAWGLGWLGDSATAAFKTLLYGIFSMFGVFASVAFTIFGWAIDPNYISGPDGLLNRQSIYVNWKFIRDFFNLFFILTLLYTAFTIVFQVAKNYKQTLLSLVLAAMFVNFSFPITRVLIDVTNVPMYYFANKLATTEDGKPSLGTVLSSSQLENILIPDKVVDTPVSQLLMAIIFLFIFSITLLVLAVMFVIRLAALVILLIFSSVGFAAAVIPGLGEYSTKWWKALWQYTLFGPAAMLMLVIVTRFFSEIAKDNTKAQFLAASTSNATLETSGFISAMAMFTIPIIMLWMVMGLASSMSLLGAGAVVGRGERFAKWVGKKSYNNPIGRGLGAGLKKAGMDGKVLGFDYGKRAKILTGNYWTAPSKTEAGLKGLIVNRKTGMRSELQKLKDKQIHEQMAKDKENKLSRTDAIGRLNSTDDVMRISAATSLANMDNGIQSMDDLTKALDALKQIDPATGNRTVVDSNYTEKAVEIIAKADKKIIGSTKDPAGVVISSGLQNLNSVIGSLGTNQKAISDLIAKMDDSAFDDGTGADYTAVHNALEAIKPGMGATLEVKAKKEGKTDALLTHKFNTRTNPALTRADFALEMLKKMEAADIAKQEMFRDAASPNRGYATAYMASIAAGGVNENISRWQKIRADLP